MAGAPSKRAGVTLTLPYQSVPRTSGGYQPQPDPTGFEEVINSLNGFGPSPIGA
jgi:hypothetical protein